MPKYAKNSAASEVNQLNAAKGIELLAAQRWLDRLVAHTYRFSNVLYESILKMKKGNLKWLLN